MSLSDLARGLVLSAAFLLAACGDTPVDDCGPGTGVECPSNDEIVAGVNLTELFAPPTPEELLAVEATWASGGREVTDGEEVDLGGREIVTVVSGGGGLHGAIRQPPRPVGDQRLRPLLFVFGGDPDVDIAADVASLAIADALKNEFVLVFVVPRGGSVRAGGQTFGTVPGVAAPFDLANVADALELLAFVRQRAAQFGASSARVGFVGYGSGGTKALLAAARTREDTYILSLAAPTSFLLPSVRDAGRAYLRGQVYDAFPGLTPVLDLSAGRLRDGTATPETARLELIARSPALFVEPVQTARPAAFLFAAHGRRDTVVPATHLGALDPLVRASGGLVLPLDEATHETILQSAEVLSTGRAFLCDTLLRGETICPN